MSTNEQNIDALCKVLRNNFFIETDDDCEEQSRIRNRITALMIAKEFNYSLAIISGLLGENNFDTYQNEYEVFEIKKLIIESLTFIDVNGDYLLSLALNENIDSAIRSAVIWNMQYIANKENILKLKTIFDIDSDEINNITFTIIKVFGKRPIFELIEFLKSQQKLHEHKEWSMSIEEIKCTLKKIELCYGI